MIEERFEVRWENGIHARRAAELVLAAKPYQAKVTLSTGARTADARSVMSLLSLGAVRGTELLVRVDGPDETAALASVMHALAQARE